VGLCVRLVLVCRPVVDNAMGNRDMPKRQLAYATVADRRADDARQKNPAGRTGDRCLKHICNRGRETINTSPYCDQSNCILELFFVDG